MDEHRGSEAFLDRLLGFQQALDAALSEEDIAGLVCRMVERVAGVARAGLCLGGRMLPASLELPTGCRACAFLRQGAWSLSDHPEAATGGCCVGHSCGWRSYPVRNHRRLHGFLVLAPSRRRPSGSEAAAVATILETTAMALENRDLHRQLGVAQAHLQNLRDGLERPMAEPAGTRWPGSEGADLLSRALEQSPASILVTGPDGTIQYANPGFVKATGYQPHEVIGRNPSLLKSGLTPPEEYRVIWQVITGGGTWRGEFHNRRKDGGLYWAAASISPVRDQTGTTTHYLAVEEDITALKALEERLRQSEERYRGASEASRDGLFILDAVRDDAGSVEDFRFAEINAAGCTLIGRHREHILGQLLSTVQPLARAKGFFDKYRRVFLRHEVLDEQLQVEAEGSGRAGWIHHTVVPLADGIAITSRDISELKRDEAALKAARAAAEDANSAKSVFLATMSHELRTPLNAILGFSELIRDQVFGPIGVARYVTYAADIHISGQHLLDMITAILDISKIEAGKLELELQPLDPVSVLHQCTTLVRNRAEGEQLQLIEDFADGLPRLWADERALRQIILNLLSNAIKFTPTGGAVTLRAVMTDPEWLDISVSDTGIGIPDDQVERVMKPFEQLDNRYTRGAGGTGLGLALVKALAELHGGSVTLESKLQHGTVVCVRLPRRGPVRAAASGALLAGPGGGVYRRS